MLDMKRRLEACVSTKLLRRPLTYQQQGSSKENRNEKDTSNQKDIIEISMIEKV